ncbi:GFA family protein [Ruegeria marina]|uniref:GFA family protein n=1 Tax=Ruegeria marina TaxID=639004 RepID=UPI001C40ADE8|nr:GFA family protein [Ruegeria marina]
MNDRSADGTAIVRKPDRLPIPVTVDPNCASLFPGWDVLGDIVMTSSYKGKCFCGAVEFEVTGTPQVMGFCHCNDCREWMGAPVNAFSLWVPEAVRITTGEDYVTSYSRSEHSIRKSCSVCGGSIMTDHPTFQLIDVYPALLRDFAYQPSMHVHYGSRMIPIRDGLPKFRDLPAEIGGSGEMLPE